MALLPELYALALAVVFLFLSLNKERSASLLFTTARVLSLAGFVVVLASVTQKGDLFWGAYRLDFFSQVFKVLIYGGFTLVVFMAERDDEVHNLPEYYMFLSLSTLGLMLLSSAVELITIAVSLEVSSFSLYAVVPLRQGQKKNQLEAAVKYLFFGAVSTGIMLYGMGYLYGIAHSTFLADVIVKYHHILSRPWGALALLLTLSAFFFKLSLFPFHFWAPDVYEGASDTTTTFVATVPKIAAAALLIRLVMLASFSPAETASILMWLAAFSMTLGNLVGLVQKDLKRLLAYSGIAHAGYLMLGLLAFNADGNAAVVYYTTVYLFMNLAIFYVIMLLGRTAAGGNILVNDLAGLARRSPLLALTMAAAAFSLAGIPPTGGFTGKLFLFIAAFEKGHMTIVIVAVVNTVISIFYYLNLVRVGYSREEETPRLALALHEKILCLMFIVVIIALGLFPYGLIDLFQAMMQ